MRTDQPFSLAGSKGPLGLVPQCRCWAQVNRMGVGGP